MGVGNEREGGGEGGDVGAVAARLIKTAGVVNGQFVHVWVLRVGVPEVKRLHAYSERATHRLGVRRVRFLAHR